MARQLAAIWPIIAGVAAMIAILLRISYQLGGLVKEFHQLILDQAKLHADLEARMRVQESRRR